MFKRFIFLFLLIILLSSCTHELNKRESYVTKKEKELNLKNIELEKKEKELSQKEKELNVKLLKINKKEKEIEKKDNSKKKEEKILVEKQEEMDKLKADIAKSLWVKDSKKVLEIFKPLVKYFKNKNDTNIQEKEKKRLFDVELKNLNEKYRGKIISFDSTVIKNVYETEALYYLVKDIDHEPTKCYVNYGHGNELYYIDEIWNWDCSEDEYGVITGLEFDINAVVSKKRALSLAKDTKTPIKIKILELKYDEYSTSHNINIKGILIE